MKSYLLDTHTALWYFSGDGELPEAAREAMVDVHNNVFISMLSLWAIAIKLSLKKLSLPRPAHVRACLQNKIQAWIS